jgi:hypothetical protein
MITSKVLACTPENLLSTYKEDAIGRNHFLYRFIHLLNCLEGSSIIALDGHWGSGKSFFVKQAKMVLDAHNPYIKHDTLVDKEEICKAWKEIAHSMGGKELSLKKHVCVYYDSWLHDDDEDPLLSLIFEIYCSIKNEYAFHEMFNILDVLGNVVDAVSGKSISKIRESLKRQKDPFQSLLDERELSKKIKEFLNSLLAEQGERLVIIVDELDRCNPIFAVRLLEKIKHYFDNENITFILSINSYELQNTIKNYYGERFNATGYLNRFIDLRVVLPPVDLQSYFRYLRENSNRYPVEQYLIEEYGFQLRDIAKYILMINIVCPKNTSYYSSDTSLVGRVFVPILVALQMHNLDKYHDFINGIDSSPLVDLANNSSLAKWINRIFGDNGANKDTDMLKKQLDETYHCFFDASSEENTVGSLIITSNMKELIMEIISMLSDYANYL